MTNTKLSPRSHTSRTPHPRTAVQVASKARIEAPRAEGELSLSELEQVVGGGARTVTGTTWLTRTGVIDDGV